MAKPSEPIIVYQIKVTLQGIKPLIWRRFQATNDMTLYQLHQILQIVMGWTDSHLHQFIIGGEHYSVPDPYDEMGSINEKRVKLSQVISGPKAKFIYEYDFGDGWQHDILIEKILAPEAGTRYPICLDGKRACPPDDCGGIWGYVAFLEAIQKSDHPDHEDMLEWIGGSFDPEAFNLVAINEALKVAIRATRRA